MANGFQFLDPMHRSTYLEADYPGTIQEAVEYVESLPRVNPNGPKLRPQLQKDGYYKQDGVDDGHISTFEKIKAFVKGGTYNMVRGLFCDKDGFSLSRTLTTAAVGTAIALTGPIGMAIAGGVGLLGGVGHFLNSTSKANSATTDQQAREAYEGIGEGTSTIGLSLFGGFKGLKAIKNNFAFAKSHPNLEIRTTDKLIRWDASKYAKPVTQRQQVEETASVTEETTSVTEETVIEKPPLKPKRTPKKKSVKKPTKPRKKPVKEPTVPKLKGFEGDVKNIDTTITEDALRSYTSPYRPTNTHPDPIGEANHFFG